MRIEWMGKKGGGRVVVFFNGWGMSSHAVSHLKTDSDVVICYDYATLKCEKMPELSAYREVYLAAWSMGVWAAANVIPEWGIKPAKSVALNGTERPVDDSSGIPEKIYRLTENGMNARGAEKFITRMLPDAEERARFLAQSPLRDIEEAARELQCIRTQSLKEKKSIDWDTAYVSDKDVIFPSANQLNWWEGKTDVKHLSGGHYPLYHFDTWEDLFR